MLVPQESPCPECGHPRRDHHVSSSSPLGEKCRQCACVIPIAVNEFVGDPNAAPERFDWGSAIDLLVATIPVVPLFSDILPSGRPGYAITPREIDDLRTVEYIVRDIWNRYAPRRPSLDRRVATVAEENAAVDRYESEKESLKRLLGNLTANEEWRQALPPIAHQ